MPGPMSISILLDSVGVSKAALDKAVEEAARESVIRTTKAAWQYWWNLTPVGESVRPHPIMKGGGHIIESGTARDSLRFKLIKKTTKQSGSSIQLNRN